MFFIGSHMVNMPHPFYCYTYDQVHQCSHLSCDCPIGHYNIIIYLKNCTILKTKLGYIKFSNIVFGMLCSKYNTGRDKKLFLLH